MIGGDVFEVLNRVIEATRAMFTDSQEFILCAAWGRDRDGHFQQQIRKAAKGEQKSHVVTSDSQRVGSQCPLAAESLPR